MHLKHHSSNKSLFTPSFAFIWLFLYLFFSPINLQAWSRLGHEVIANIAQAHLNDPAKQALSKLLSPNLPLAAIAVCADDIKYRSISCGDIFAVSRQEESKPWHYIDIPLNKPQAQIKIMDYCPQDSCILGQLPLEVQTLKDSAKTLIQKQMALMFLVHLVGDLHQPLHCSAGFDSLDIEDQGGNLKTVHFTLGGFTRKMNLHELWDKTIQKPDAEQNTDAIALADSLDSAWTRSKQILLLGSWEDYAWEGYAISKEIIYPNYDRNQGELESDYQKQMQPIAYHQLQIGGLRLAAILNSIFSGTPIKNNMPSRKQKIKTNDNKTNINSLGQEQIKSSTTKKKNPQVLFKAPK